MLSLTTQGAPSYSTAWGYLGGQASSVLVLSGMRFWQVFESRKRSNAAGRLNKRSPVKMVINEPLYKGVEYFVVNNF